MVSGVFSIIMQAHRTAACIDTRYGVYSHAVHPIWYGESSNTSESCLSV